MSSTFWQGKAVFVTGATGLLGGHLVAALLDRGASVVALVRDVAPHTLFASQSAHPRVTLVRGDCRNFEALRRALTEHHIETVFHLAAQSLVGVAHADPLATLETNVAGTYRLLEAIRQQPKPPRLVLASSDQAYSPHEPLPWDETARLEGRAPYAVSKSCADLIAQSYALTYSLPIGIARCGNFYGPGDLNWNRIVPGTIRSVLRGERPVIRSNGRHLRGYLYIQDGVRAHLALAEALEARPELHGQAFNFGHAEPVSVLAMVTKILQACGREDLTPDVRGEAQNEVLNQSLDVTKAREVLGWKAGYSLETGLRETLAWYRKFLEN